jgi:hypothetical protein
MRYIPVNLPRPAWKVSGRSLSKEEISSSFPGPRILIKLSPVDSITEIDESTVLYRSRNNSIWLVTIFVILFGGFSALKEGNHLSVAFLASLTISMD